MRNLVLIMSSHLVDQDMRAEVGRIPPALIPVNGQPLYRAICDKFASLPGQTEKLLVVSQARDKVEQSLLVEDVVDVELVNVPLLPDLGDALVAALEDIGVGKYDNLILNFGDTLIETDLDLSTNTIYYADLEESYRWTTFTESRGQILNISDKGLVENAEGNHVFTGLFLIKNVGQFLDNLRQAKSTTQLSKFYCGLKSYLDGCSYRLTKVRDWHDFGHIDNYYQARKKFVNKRFFNEILIDEKRAIVTKRSANVEKLKSEINWYLTLPGSLRCYTPQVFESCSQGSSPWISMEFYGYPTVSELYLNSGHDLGIWSHLFKNLFQVIDEMRTHRLDVSVDEAKKAYSSIYLDKTIDRLNTLRDHPILGRFFAGSVAINGQSYHGLDWYIEHLAEVNAWLEPTTNQVSIIHGDLCISNILFDSRSRIIKLIDPRGEFGAWSLYGDYRYDLAKLSHSFNGNYDSIINNRFFVLCEDTELSVSYQLEPYQERIVELFNRQLKIRFANDLASVELIEALLFLSMIPLHADYINRQLAFLAVGIQKLDRSLRRRGLDL